MKTGLKRTFLPVLILSAVVLFVFYTLRDYGPGSAVRRFHEDLLQQNYVDLQQVCLQPISTNADVGRIAMFVKDMEESGAVPKLATQERHPNEVDVLVLYQLNQTVMPFVWVVAYTPNTGWKVDATQTFAANPSLKNG